MFTNNSFGKGQSGNATIVTLVVLAVLAVGGLAYFSTYMKDKPAATTESTLQTTQGAENVEPQAAGETQATDAQAGEPAAIEPGNPVVAKINGDEVNRVDVFNFIQSLPPQTRQMPIDKLFPAALEQVINARVIAEQTEDVNLESDPEVQKQMEMAKKNIVRNVYVQKEVEKRITEDRINKAFEQYKENFPDITEVKVRHILVADEKLAKDLISQLNEGGDFAALAKQHSTDGTAQNGGEVGYFAENEVVPAFAKAAFSTDVGTYTKDPVKTDFGYHVIEVQDKRQRPPATLEQIKPLLEADLRRILLNELLNEWRSTATIERYDINGKNAQPAAGG